jgi:hypothetical protein
MLRIPKKYAGQLEEWAVILREAKAKLKEP